MIMCDVIPITSLLTFFAEKTSLISKVRFFKTSCKLLVTILCRLNPDERNPSMNFKSRLVGLSTPQKLRQVELIYLQFQDLIDVVASDFKRTPMVTAITPNTSTLKSTVRQCKEI